MNALDIESISQPLGEAIPLNSSFNIVLWSLILFNLIIFAFVSTSTPSYFRVLFNTAFSNRHLISNTRDHLNLRRLSSILLNFTYFNCLAIIIWLVTQHTDNQSILIFSGVLILSFILKLIFMQAISFISNYQLGIYTHFLNHFIFFQVGGIVLTPVILFTYYLPKDYYFISLGILIIISVLLLLMREFLSIVRAVQGKVSLFYIILYLCTLELLPLIVIIRILS